MWKRRVTLALVAVSLTSLAAIAAPDPKISFKKGVLHGRVLDADGKPIANATVALQQPDGKTLAWAKTNAKGEYDLAADPKQALNLKPSHCRGLLEECVRVAGGAAMAAVRVVGGTVLNPGATAHAGAVAVAGGTSGAAVAQGTVLSVPTAATAPGQVGQAAGAAATDSALTGAPKKTLPPEEQRGHAVILVTAQGFKDASIADAPYWMDPATDDKSNPIGIQAWMQSIKLAPTAGDKKCELVPASITLSDLDVQPSLTPVGSDIQVKVKLNAPDPSTDQKIRIFARLASKNTVVELLPIAGQAGFYGAKFGVDPKTPPGQTVLSVGALRAEPVEVKLNSKKADPLVAFVGSVDDMNGAKPYGYDPFVMASENRLDAKVTILAKKP